MKFKNIKPGMVIHCPTEEDARALLKRLKKVRYRCVDEVSDTIFEHYSTAPVEDGQLAIMCLKHTIDFDDIRYYRNVYNQGHTTLLDRNVPIVFTEFSDLIDTTNEEETP